MELEARVDREEALAFLGHRGQELGELRERLERAACLCEKELVPRGVYREMGASEALALLPGHDIARHVEGCARVVLLAVTLGTQSEILLRRERALSATDGLLVDACASSLVEQAANVLNAHIVEEAAARGLAATSRFSPGYGDLPLSCQPAFLVASGADRALGICATAAHLLVPAKSITAVIGLHSRPNSAREGGASTAPTEGNAAAGTAPVGGDLGRPSAPTVDPSREESAPSPMNTAPLDSRCSTCPLADTCALRAEGRTCYGNPA